MLAIFGPWLLWALSELIQAAKRAFVGVVKSLARRGLLAVKRLITPGINRVNRVGRYIVRLLRDLSRPWRIWSSQNLVCRMLDILEPEFAHPTIQDFKPDKVPYCTFEEIDLQETVIGRYGRLMLWICMPSIFITLTIGVFIIKPIRQLLMLIPPPVGYGLDQGVSLLVVLYAMLVWYAIVWPFAQRARAWREQIDQLVKLEEAQKEVVQISDLLGDRTQALYADYLHAVERTRLVQQEGARVERAFELLRTLPKEQQDDVVFAFKKLMDSYRDEIAKSSSESERRERIWEVFINLNNVALVPALD